MNVLITGGAGFIGSHLCDYFVKKTSRVVCLDNLMSGSVWNIRHLLDFKNFKFVKGDIRDRELVNELVKGTDVAIHLAAQVHVDRSYIEPELTWDINVKGTQNILEASRFHDVGRVVMASSSEVYGSAVYSPMDECHPLKAPHPYGASKVAADRLCYSYIQTFDMPIVILRCFNVFGPRQKDFGYGGIISLFARRVLQGFPPVIFGDGLQTRDYTYVSDTVRAYAAAADLASKCVKEPVNIGTGRDISINDIATEIIRFANKPLLKPVYAPKRPSEVRHLICDPALAQATLMWKPLVEFKDGIGMLMKWYETHGFQSD